MVNHQNQCLRATARVNSTGLGDFFVLRSGLELSRVMTSAIGMNCFAVSALRQNLKPWKLFSQEVRGE